MTDDYYTGYATENVVPVSDDEAEAMASWVEAHLWAEHHVHNGYGWAGCARCRHREAERVSRRFPTTTYHAVAERPLGEQL